MKNKTLKQPVKLKNPVHLKASSFLNTGKSDFNVIKFLLLYVLLLQGFYLYVGITSEGGKLFSHFLNKYADFPSWLSITIAGLSKLVLEVCGFNVYQINAANITIAGSRGVTLAFGCLGAGAMSLWVAFIVAHKAGIGFKLKWMAAGLGLICFINTLRAVMIALSNHYHWTYIRHFDAHTSFNMVTYAFIVLLMYIFVRRYNRVKEKKAAA